MVRKAHSVFPCTVMNSLGLPTAVWLGQDREFAAIKKLLLYDFAKLAVHVFLELS